MSENKPKDLGTINEPEQVIEPETELTEEEIKKVVDEKEKERLKNLETAENLKTTDKTFKNFDKLKKMIEPVYITTHKPDELFEVCKEYTKRYKEYLDKADLKLEELEKIEQDLIKIAQDWETELRKKIYGLPNYMKFQDGKRYNVSQVGKMICNLLNKIEVGYQETLGLYQLYTWWENPKTEIPFDYINSTLRVLGSSVKFKGYDQWKSILIINEFFSGTHDEFTKDTTAIQFVAAIHEALMDKMELNKPIEAKETPAEVGPAMIVENEEQLQKDQAALAEQKQ